VGDKKMITTQNKISFETHCGVGDKKMITTQNNAFQMKFCSSVEFAGMDIFFFFVEGDKKKNENTIQSALLFMSRPRLGCGLRLQCFYSFFFFGRKKLTTHY